MASAKTGNLTYNSNDDVHKVHYNGNLVKTSSKMAMLSCILVAGTTSEVGCWQCSQTTNGMAGRSGHRTCSPEDRTARFYVSKPSSINAW